MKNLQKTFLKKSNHRTVVAIISLSIQMFTCFHRKASLLPQSTGLIPHPQSPQPGNKALGRDERLPWDCQAYSTQEAAWGLRWEWTGWDERGGEEKRKEGWQGREERKGSRVKKKGPALYLDNLLCFINYDTPTPPLVMFPRIQKNTQKDSEILELYSWIRSFFHV